MSATERFKQLFQARVEVEDGADVMKHPYLDASQLTMNCHGCVPTAFVFLPTTTSWLPLFLSHTTTMLKRRREADSPSCAPSTSYMALDEHTLHDIPTRNLKRARTEAPILDGPDREMRTGFSDPMDDDDGEEEWISDEEQRGQEGSRSGAEKEALSLSAAAITAKEYRATNSLLHDLHTENRHRLMFSSTPSAFLHSDSAFRPTPSIRADSSKGYLSAPLPPPSARWGHRPLSPAKAPLQGSFHGVDKDSGIEMEVERVMEQYHDQNKYVMGILHYSTPF